MKKDKAMKNTPCSHQLQSPVAAAAPTIWVSVAIRVMGSQCSQPGQHLQGLFLPWLIPANIPQGRGAPALCTSVNPR